MSSEPSELEHDAVSTRRPQDSDSEDDGEDRYDDEYLVSSVDDRIQNHEKPVAEEEAERLLSGEHERQTGGASNSHGHDGTSAGAVKEKSSSRKTKRRVGRKNNRFLKSEAPELANILEKGQRASSESSANSSETDFQTLKETRAERKGLRSGGFAAIHVIIIAAFLALLYGAYRASRRSNVSQDVSPLTIQSLSNGTHEFAPTTILISLDGFRADFLYRGLTPVLSSFIQQGVSPKYMLPSFPSLTFPNHFTLVTGLYPEAHGIVSNAFWDPSTGKEFYYTDPLRSMTPEWWLGEPLWETAELQGMPSAIHMWPGSEAHIGTKEPTYVDKFDADEPLDEKVDRILHWLDLPGAHDSGVTTESPRPQLIAAYVPNVDADGHAYGPNSTYIKSTIAEVDGMLGMLFRGIDERNLTDIVNIIIVSDHGMATTSNLRMIQLEDLVDTSLIQSMDGWPLYGLRPYDSSHDHLQQLYKTIRDKAESPKYKGTFEVYLRDENMPERYHYSQNQRIAPLWLVPTAGWAIVTKDEFDVEVALQQNLLYYPRGLHGYDHEHPLMRAIFMARGPAFPHPKGSQVDVFQNLEVYNIVCDSLGLTPKANNGTLRLPFTPIGVHDVELQGETPEDPGQEDGSVQLLPPMIYGLPVPDLPEASSEMPSEQGDGHVKRGTLEWRAWLQGRFNYVRTRTTEVFGLAGTR